LLLLLLLLLLPLLGAAVSVAPAAALQLPDGTEIQVGMDRFALPELLFRPVSDGGVWVVCMLVSADHAMDSQQHGIGC
jgi:hypothetical protein